MVEKKKVVLVINCLQGGGAEKSVLTLGEGFYDLGCEVHIIRFKSTVEYELSKNLMYHQIDFKPYRVIPNSQLRYKLFSKQIDRYINTRIGKPALIVSNLDKSDNVMSYSKLPNIVYVIRNNLSKKVELLSHNKDMRLPHLKKIYTKHPCVCISSGVEQDLKHLLDIKNVTTIYNPIDSNKIRSLANEEMQLEFKDFILHVGSFKVQKAHDILIQAYAKTDKSLPLLLLGKGKLFQDMKDLVSSLGLEDNVKFIGFHKNPYPYIKQAKLLVLSSHFEGFGRVIAEAQVLDTPIISTDCPSGPRELLPESNLVPVADIDALAKKMQAAMHKPNNYLVPFDDKFLPVNIAKQYMQFAN